jgi:hypothetical protein
MSLSLQSFIPAKAFLLSLLLDYNATHCSWLVLTIQLDTRTLSYTGMGMVLHSETTEEPDPAAGVSLSRSLSPYQSQQNRSNEKQREILDW